MALRRYGRAPTWACPLWKLVEMKNKNRKWEMKRNKEMKEMNEKFFKKKNKKIGRENFEMVI